MKYAVGYPLLVASALLLGVSESLPQAQAISSVTAILVCSGGPAGFNGSATFTTPVAASLACSDANRVVAETVAATSESFNVQLDLAPSVGGPVSCSFTGTSMSADGACHSADGVFEVGLQLFSNP
jgi:hypothetical protein